MDRWRVDFRWTCTLAWLAAAGTALAPSPAVRPGAPAPARAPAAPPSQAELESEPMVFAPQIRAPRRRLPTRPQVCVQAPPPGRFTQLVSTSSRGNACGAAVEVLTEAMDVSEDHCPLYRETWSCFVGQAAPLEMARNRTFDAFARMLPRFEGDDGFETALALWDADPRARATLNDLFGAPTLADHIIRFLELELAAIEGLAAEYDRGTSSKALVDAWARREAVVAWHKTGPVWDLVDEYDSAIAEALSARLARVAEMPSPPEVVAARHNRRNAP